MEENIFQNRWLLKQIKKGDIVIVQCFLQKKIYFWHIVQVELQTEVAFPDAEYGKFQ